MRTIPVRLRALGTRLADRFLPDPAEGVNEWGPTNQPCEFLPPLAPHNAWGWSPPNPPVADVMGPDGGREDGPPRERA